MGCACCARRIFARHQQRHVTQLLRVDDAAGAAGAPRRRRRKLHRRGRRSGWVGHGVGIGAAMLRHVANGARQHEERLQRRGEHVARRRHLPDRQPPAGAKGVQQRLQHVVLQQRNNRHGAARRVRHAAALRKQGGALHCTLGAGLAHQRVQCAFVNHRVEAAVCELRSSARDTRQARGNEATLRRYGAARTFIAVASITSQRILGRSRTCLPIMLAMHTCAAAEGVSGATARVRAFVWGEAGVAGGACL